MKRVNVNLYPKDGYYFKDRDGAKIVGANWREVIARVEDYRKRNGFALGNPEQEVHDQACEHNPAYCSEVTEQQREMTRIVSLKGRVLAWLAGKIKSREKEPLVFVSPQTADARARICRGCSKNTAVSDGCSSCKAALLEYRRNILGSNRPINESITGCVILGEDLSVATFLEEQAVDNSELPAHCWRKRSL
jgi:hypothetical protein